MKICRWNTYCSRMKNNIKPIRNFRNTEGSNIQWPERVPPNDRAVTPPIFLSLEICKTTRLHTKSRAHIKRKALKIS
jgi:hypothetical protein